MILPGHFSSIKRSDTSTIFYVSATTTSELILKSTTTTLSETSYLDTTLNIGEGNRTVRISVYDKREDFNFKILNFPYLDSNIPRNPAYGVYISQLVRYARMTSYTDTDVCL